MHFVLQSNLVFTLQHADSMDTLLTDCSQNELPATASATNLSSSMDEAETERPAAEENTSGWLSLDWLSTNSLENCRLELPFHRAKEEKKEEVLENAQRQSGEDEDDEIVVKDEQVADFATSVLAAISCWRYKARALLFTRVPTVRLTVTICFFSLLLHLALFFSVCCCVLNSHMCRIPRCCM